MNENENVLGYKWQVIQRKRKQKSPKILLNLQNLSVFEFDLPFQLAIICAFYVGYF